MPGVSFKRLINISPLFIEVEDWIAKHQDAGFFLLDDDKCDLFSTYDPNWMGEEGWVSAIDQYIYAEFMVRDNKNSVQVVDDLSLMEQIMKKDGVTANLSIRDCGDDFCLEILTSEIMVRYCVGDNSLDSLWQMVVKETAVMARLYELNNKGSMTFWNDLLTLNKHLGVISERPVVRFLTNTEPLENKTSFSNMTDIYSEIKIMELDPSIPVPKNRGEEVEMMIQGKRKSFAVEKSKTSYLHPLGKLSEIAVYLSEL